MRECYLCKEKADKLYEFRGWEVCWNCYFKKVDEDFAKKVDIIKKLHPEDIDPNYEQAQADRQ